MYVIHPFEGCNDISFGMTSDEIQDKVKKTPEKYYKCPDDPCETDAYGDFHVYYKKPGVCEAIEFTDEAQVSYLDVPLFEKTYQELEAWFMELDENLLIEADGFTSEKLGIGVYAPEKKESELYCPIESVIIFEKGYYDDL